MATRPFLHLSGHCGPAATLTGILCDAEVKPRAIDNYAAIAPCGNQLTGAC